MTPHATAPVNGINGVKHDFTPMAICGMACRLPGGIRSPQDLWEFLISKGDARSEVPETRYNKDAYHSTTGRPGSVASKYGYFLDEDLTTFDGSFFTMSPMELERCDPQQRQMLEIARECIDDAGETDWKGRKIGVYTGSFGEDWFEISEKEPQQYGVYRVAGTGDFSLANRVSYEMNLQGPSMTIRTACAASLVALNEACIAIDRGQCESAIVGGTSLILCPGMTQRTTEQGVLSPDGDCKPFSADANGYGRAEAINAVFIKPLSDALRDGNPVRAVIRGTGTNSDGKTPGLTHPSSDSQEALIRTTYNLAGITDFSDTGFVECHGTGTPVGDPIETNAIARVFGDSGVYIGSVKGNLGHSEGASGLTSLIKSVLALENRVIPPNIKFAKPNPNIPFETRKLTVPVEPTPWPESQRERISINSFGIGGANAHVIIDSASSFNASIELEEASDIPQLLTYSANSSESLSKMTDNYGAYLDKYPERIEDVAFTLANRREHLPHRAFLVASREKLGTASSPSKPVQTPNIIMVFTGQGAQWPQMGRDLIKSNKVFSSTIKSLDQHLHSLGGSAPEWTIDAELRKTAKTSRLGSAELAQPLCTAIQIALVDTFAAVGIVPAAVVGHSSGEIAGAYASGALTAAEAITAAFHRGAITKKQTRIGGMAAIGMGWDEVKEFLIPGVTVACENSPKSVTLSGDADKIDEVVNAIKNSKPDVLARLLKVDKAYHSYHMAEIGEDYHSLIANKVQDKPPTKPFFSSVTGELLGEGEQLGARYWQKNLESPVLFRSAVSSIIQHPIGQNAMFLEIGPHSALAGPVRQTLTAASISSPYVASMLRGQNCTEVLLSVIGKLYTLHVPVDFEALIPEGVSLPELPRYPWNHSGSYWYESRISKEWRQREFPLHNLLGVKTLESTDFEPVWRNLFHLDNAPWVRDHKIAEDVVFPFAGYVGMVAEAVRQATGVQEGVKLRNVVVSTALVVSDGKPIELVTSFRKHRLTKSLDSQWWEFTIGSHNGHVWTKHCTGEVTEMAESLGTSENAAELPRKVDTRKWYNVMRQTGLNYGPPFQGLEDIRVSTSYPGLSTAKVRNNRQGDEADYHLHPTIFDTTMQLLGCAASLGLSRKYRKNLPTNVDELSISRTSSDVALRVSASYTSNGSILGNGDCIASNGEVVLRMKGLKLALLEEPKNRDSHAAARHVWNPHIDFLDAKDLIRPSFNHSLYTPTLDELTQLCLISSHRALAGAEPGLPHLQKYHGWIESQVQSSGVSSLTQLDNEELRERIKARVDRLSDTPAADAALAMSQISAAVAEIFSEEREALDVLHENDTLAKLQGFVNESDPSKFLRHLTHSKPNLRVLELRAGAGSSTAKILKHLAPSEERVFYSKYTFSDLSSDFFATAKERFNGVRNLEFNILDISMDIEEQGFEDAQYDLIIATNAIHDTDNLARSLKNVRKLLHPEGRLLLQELCPSSKWINYVLGVFPNWWRGGSDGRVDEPYVDSTRWEAELRAAGFAGLDAVIADSDAPFQLNSIMVARLEATKTASKQVTLLCADKTSDPGAIAQELQNRGYKVDRTTIDEDPPVGQDIISLLDKDTPFFEKLSGSSYDRFKAFLNNLGDSSLFWITHLSPIRSQDPRYGQVVGFARTMRSEMDIDFAVCQTDAGFSDSRVLDVFEKFQVRQPDEVLNPEMEYAVYNGEVNVGRFHPFVLTDDMMTSGADDRVVLGTDRPGHLADLKWSHQPVEDPVRDQVDVEVYSTGLNFRDVLVAMGIVELSEPLFGLESAGIVRRVGPEVKTLKPGDRVMIFGRHTFASTVTLSELLCTEIPDELSFNDAATMPCVYITTIYSMMNIGNLEKGQSILIHSGCGGIGIAAIQIAQMIGAEIFTTVGNEEKVQYLMKTFNIPRNRIFNSRDTSFVDGIMRETDGNGVDLVLNSLSGELLHATWRCVTEFGKMVEIGKRDIMGAGKLDMDVFLLNRTYACVDVDRIRTERPKVISKLLCLITKFLREGHIKPIRPIKTFKASELHDAFRYMQQGLHMGKIVIELRQSAQTTHLNSGIAERRKTPKFDSSGSYLLVGGLGGLGRSISIWMVEHGARNLVFLSRSAGSRAEDQEFVQELESMGCEVQLVKGSVANIEDVTRAVKIPARPLKGVIQMSMVLRDQAFPKMTWDDWETAVSPKVQGTWNLHNATEAASSNLDFFVLFSSLSGIIGQPGQANYTSANTFLDAFCQFRSEKGLAASSINIGAVEDIGFIAQKDDLLRQMKSTGFYSVNEKDLLDALVVATAPPSHRTIVPGLTDPGTFVLGLASTIPLTSGNNRAVWRKDPRMAVYHNTAVAADSSASGANDGIKAFISSARADPGVLESAESANKLAQEIGKKLLDLLMKPDEELNTGLGLSDLGMDSLVAIEMRTWWKQMFGFDISVLEMLGMGTLDALGKHAAEGLIKAIRGG